MRVALLGPTPLSGTLRGLEREMVELSTHLALVGHDVEILTVATGADVGVASPHPAPRVPVRRVEGVAPASLAGIQERRAPLVVRRLAATLRRYDVVVAYNAGWPLTLVLALTGRRGLPPIVYRTYWHPPFGRREWLNGVRRFVAGLAFRRAAVLLAPTAEEGELLRGATAGAVPVEVSEPGVGPAEGAGAGWEGAPAGAVLVAHIGTPSVPKGFADSLDVVAELRRRGHDAHLVVIGAAPDDATSALLVEGAAGLAHCHLLGAADDATKTSVLAASDAVVVLSRYEAFSFVALEALRAGAGAVVVWDDFPSARTLRRYGVRTVARAGGAVAVASEVEAALATPAPPGRAGLRPWSAFGDDVARLLERVTTAAAP